MDALRMLVWLVAIGAAVLIGGRIMSELTKQARRAL